MSFDPRPRAARAAGCRDGGSARESEPLPLWLRIAPARTASSLIPHPGSGSDGTTHLRWSDDAQSQGRSPATAAPSPLRSESSDRGPVDGDCRRYSWGLSRRTVRLPRGVRASRGGSRTGGGFTVGAAEIRSPDVRLVGVSSELPLARVDAPADSGEGGRLDVNSRCLVAASAPRSIRFLSVLRSARPDLEVVVHAVDVSAEVVDVAEAGVYSPGCRPWWARDLRPTDGARVAGHVRLEGRRGAGQGLAPEGIEWEVADACDPELVSRLGSQDIVVASNFLCHMEPASAERCLRNMARLVEPGGYLFVTGVDLGVRTDVACDLGWKPVDDLLVEIHDADPALRNYWPWDWAGLEPLDRRRPDWRTRYATAFRINLKENVQRAPPPTRSCRRQLGSVVRLAPAAKGREFPDLGPDTLQISVECERSGVPQPDISSSCSSGENAIDGNSAQSSSTTIGRSGCCSVRTLRVTTGTVPGRATPTYGACRFHRLQVRDEARRSLRYSANGFCGAGANPV